MKGQHFLDHHGIWKFSKKNLKSAIIAIAYPSEDKCTGRVKELHDLIQERFENGGLDEFYQWSKNINNEIEISPPLQLLTEDIDGCENTESEDDEDSFESIIRKNRKRITELEKSIVAFRATGVPGHGAGTVIVDIPRGKLTLLILCK